MGHKIALAQLDLKIADPNGNFMKAQDAVRNAAGQGADILLLPELWSSGFDLAQTQKYAEPIGSGWFDKMRELALENQIAVGGSLIEEDQGSFYNTFVLYQGDGRLLGSYRKIHLFQMLEEDVHFQGGNQITVIDSPWGRIGMAICYDLRFPEIFRKCAVQGAELILLVAEWPSRRIEHWNILLRARAIENQCFIAAVNKSGESQGAKLGGSSAIINPMGEIIVQGGDDEQLLIGEIEIDQVPKIRKWMPIFEDRRPGIYSSH